MKIRTGQVKHLPYERHEVTQGHDTEKMSRTLESVDRSLIVHHMNYTPSLHSTGLRLAVSIHKLSNVKLDTSVASGSVAEALQRNDWRSLTVQASRLGPSLFVRPREGGHSP
jgi:hypothetical protein